MYKRMVAPFAKPIFSSFPASCAANADSSSTLTLATTGWWEIVSPLPVHIEFLCRLFAQHRITVCAITGMPTQGLESELGGKHGYTWFGDHCTGVACVGLFVSNAYRTKVFREPHESLPSARFIAIRLGSHCIQATYPLYLGQKILGTDTAIPTSEVKSFLSLVVAAADVCDTLAASLSAWAARYMLWYYIEEQQSTARRDGHGLLCNHASSALIVQHGARRVPRPSGVK